MRHFASGRHHRIYICHEEEYEGDKKHLSGLIQGMCAKGSGRGICLKLHRYICKKGKICIQDWQSWSKGVRNDVTGDVIDVTIMVIQPWSATRIFKPLHIFITCSL